MTALIFLLAGCAGPIETRVDSSGAHTDEAARIMLDAENSDSRAEAQRLVSSALVRKGLQIAEQAEYSLHVSVSDRPADLSLTTGQQVLAPAPKHKLCAAREYRLGITVTRITDGLVAYRAHAAEFHCKFSLQQVLPHLVNAAVKDFGAPRGNYIVKRPRRSPRPETPATSG